jgi:tetratricopeptide (TPR) repeat protein
LYTELLHTLSKLELRTEQHESLLLSVKSNLATNYIDQARNAEAHIIQLDWQLHIRKAPHDDPKAESEFLEKLHRKRNALYARAHGWYARANKLLTDVRESEILVPGGEDLNTIGTICCYAQLYYYQKFYRESSRFWTQALCWMQRHMPANHPSIMEVYGRLGATYTHMNREKEGENLLKHAIEGLECSLGSLHPDRLHFLQELATCFAHQKRLSESEVLFRQVYNDMETRHGAENFDTRYVGSKMLESRMPKQIQGNINQ